MKGYAEKFGGSDDDGGLLDGINESLKEKNPLEEIEEDSEVNLDYEEEPSKKTWWTQRLIGFIICLSGMR